MANKANFSRTHCINGHELSAVGMRSNGDCVGCANDAFKRWHKKSYEGRRENHLAKMKEYLANMTPERRAEYLQHEKERSHGDARNMEKRRAWWRDYSKKNGSRHLKQLYGMTESEYLELHEKQKGLCAICQQPERLVLKGKTAQLAVDHNHVTNQRRGLLCADCNVAVGRIKDSAAIAFAMATYLAAYSEEPNELNLSKVS